MADHGLRNGATGFGYHRQVQGQKGPQEMGSFPSLNMLGLGELDSLEGNLGKPIQRHEV